MTGTMNYRATNATPTLTIEEVKCCRPDHVLDPVSLLLCSAKLL